MKAHYTPERTFRPNGEQSSCVLSLCRGAIANRQSARALRSAFPQGLQLQ
jgi:hypothetical protein